MEKKLDSDKSFKKDQEIKNIAYMLVLKRNNKFNAYKCK